MNSFNRRTVLKLTGGGLVASITPGLVSHALAAQPVIDVTRSPNCGCCGGWIEHMRAAGFTVNDHLRDDLLPLKAELGIPSDLHSCHTGVIAGYAIEGHVPAEDVLRLVAERPSGKGIAVAGMPLGSPGMETDGQPEAFDVILFGSAGRSIFASH